MSKDYEFNRQLDGLCVQVAEWDVRAVGTQSELDDSIYVGYFPYETFGSWLHYSPMTAIVSVHTPDGFVIGADGRRRDSATGFGTEKARKVFSFESGTIQLAYAWTGITQTSKAENAPVYDLLAASQEILPQAALGSSTFAAFITVFCSALSTKLPKCFTNLPKEEIARVIFVGYFQGQPCHAQIQICYPNSFLSPRIEVHVPASYHKIIFSGSEDIFMKYKEWKPQCGAEAIDFVQTYIQDCVDSAAPDCAGIGGHIHIGRLTPTGFSWVAPPISE